MHYYTRNIGDYRRDTMHLSLLEHGIYNQLLDWYYLDEKPIVNNNPTLFRRLSARTEDEQNAVLTVLSEMFSETAKGWVHSRVERELAQYKARAAQARTAGKLGGRPSKKGAVPQENRDGFHENRDGFKNKANAVTNNQEPITKNQEEQELKSMPPLAAKPDARGTRLPADWQPTQELIDYARGKRPTMNIANEVEAFRDYWHAKAGAGARKVDWGLTFKTWVRSAYNKPPPQNAPQIGGSRAAGRML